MASGSSPSRNRVAPFGNDRGCRRAAILPRSSGERPAKSGILLRNGSQDGISSGFTSFPVHGAGEQADDGLGVADLAAFHHLESLIEGNDDALEKLVLVRVHFAGLEVLGEVQVQDFVGESGSGPVGDQGSDLAGGVAGLLLK